MLRPLVAPLLVIASDDKSLPDMRREHEPNWPIASVHSQEYPRGVWHSSQGFQRFGIGRALAEHSSRLDFFPSETGIEAKSHGDALKSLRRV